MVGLRLLRCKHWFFVVAVLLPPSPVYAQSVDAALAALARGNHAAALNILQPLAEQGHALAQLNLGLIHDNGRGVARDHAAALKWYRLAAVQGNATGSFHDL